MSVDVRQYLTPPPAPASLKLPTLPADQEDLLGELTRYFNRKDLELPVREVADGEEVEKKPLDDREMMFLSRETFIRFLLATDCDASAAITRLVKTLVWRRTEQIEDVELLAKRYKEQCRYGRGFVLGFTPNNQPIVYSFVYRNPTPVGERKGVDTTFMIERATDLMADGVSECLVVFQYGGEKIGETSSFSTTRETININSTHYPRKFSMTAFQGMPWLAKTAASAFSPFMDSRMKAQLKYDKDLVGDGDVAREVLLKQAGGDLDYTYDHETYWDALISTCLERRKDALEKWQALGERRTGREEKVFKVRPGTGA